MDQAKVFLYDSSGTKLLEEYVVSRNGKFTFENEIISGDYTIMVYGNGSGNGGDRVKVINQNVEDVKIDLSLFIKASDTIPLDVIIFIFSLLV